MTVFNPENKDLLTLGEVLDPIFLITDKGDAMQYKAAYIEYQKKWPNANGLTPEQVVNINIGYYAGYGSIEDRKRIEDLFECKHPIFGKA